VSGDCRSRSARPSGYVLLAFVTQPIIASSTRGAD
jgi:hypothetical protein